ncbi:replication factor-a protein [Rhodotorula sp. JG-1b]|nr:replication factor-a protein [Rhodotorula sp. JG-1b]
MFTSQDTQTALEPVLQVLSAKPVSSQQGAGRWRLILSDGQHFAQAMLGTNLNPLVQGDNPDVYRNTVIKLTGYAVNHVQNRKVIIVLNLDIVSHEPEKLGEPVTIENALSLLPEPRTTRAGSPSTMPSRPRQPVPLLPTTTTEQVRSDAPLFMIAGLTPYSNKWTIKARVTQKSDIRHWSNNKGDGQLFSVNLLDESGEIRATGFNKEVDRLYPILEEGKVYRITRARVNIAKKQFSNLSNEYELMFGQETEVEPVDEDQSVPKIQFDFVQLADLARQEKDTTCDVIGVVQDHGVVSEITAKATQKQIKKRELTIADRSQYQVRVTLWGRQAENWDENNASVVALKGAKVGDFGGRTLSVSGQTVVSIDPDIDEAHELQGWYQTEGQNTTFQSFNNAGLGAGAGGATFKTDVFKTLKSVVDDNLGMDEKPDFFSTRATVTYVKGDNLSYPACPTERCNKKMNQEGENQWRCEKCTMTYDAPQYRYILSMCVNDYTSQIWVSGFNEVGQDLFGKTADEMQRLKEDDETEFTRALTSALGRMYNLNIKAKADSFGDQMRVRYQIQKAAPVDWVEAATKLADEIEKW